MRQTQRAVDLWSREAMDAFAEYDARIRPAWRRKLAAENTPGEAQAKFEERAIEKEALRLYYERLYGPHGDG